MRFTLKKSHILLSLAIVLILFLSCNLDFWNLTFPMPKIKGKTTYPPSSTATEINNTNSSSKSVIPNGESDIPSKFASKFAEAKNVSDSDSWIDSTSPFDNSKDVSFSSYISISFKYDMDETTLTPDNIIIGEGKHSGIISNLFDYKYDKTSKTLNIKFKDSKNGYGTLNSIAVLVCSDIKDIDGKNMSIDVKFGFMTK